MKNNLLSILALAAMLAFSGIAYSSQPEDRPEEKGQSGNGGGGISRNGRYMTFYSAGFYTEPMEATPDEVPQLAQLIHFMNTTPYMSELTKVKYASNLVPSSVRKYYKVHASSFTPEVRARLLAEYGRVMKVNVNEVALFAITDTESKTTYLFPEFYSLRPTEQQAILFHETFWLVYPSADYKTVIQAEMSFQAHIETPASPERLLRFLRSAGTTGDILIAAIRTDLKNGSLKGFLNKGNKNDSASVSLLNLLGADFFNCKMRGHRSECFAFIHTHAYQLSLKYPNSLFIKIFYENVSKESISFSDSASSPTYAPSDYFQANNDYSKPEYWSAIANGSLNLNSFGYSSAVTTAITFDYNCRYYGCPSKDRYLYLSIGLPRR